MATCIYCGKEFSDTVILIHQEWCKEQQQKVVAPTTIKRTIKNSYGIEQKEG